MSQASELPGNAAQIEYWNAAAGDTWVSLQGLLDRQIAPMGHEALRALAPVHGEHVIDIGCGCGETSVDLAVTDAVREALSRHMTANGVLMPAAVWIVHAA